jgi:hypothetical protein
MMKKKLIKKEDDFYSLRVDGIVMATSNGMLVDYKLSKENCDEIFGVVDADKLGQKHYEVHIKRGHTQEDSLQRKIDFIIGFSKAMDLNKDKLFTIEEMKAIFAFGHQVGMNTILAIQSQHSPQPLPKQDSDKLRDEFIQSLQQPNEIEVEIRCWIGNGDKESDSFKDPLVTNTGIPKLDENGCLILRKK